MSMRPPVYKICRACLLVAVMTLGASAAAPQRADSPSRGRVMLGVRLRPEMAAWVEEIEAKLGKEIYAEFAPLGPEDASEGFVGGENYVTERGTAVLRINLLFQSDEKRSRREATLAHELLHLRQRARGFPAYAFDLSQPARGVPVRELAETGVEGDLMEAVEHALILPEMRRLGLDTVADMIGFLDWAARQRTSADSRSYAVYYLRATFEYDDPAKLRELEQTYRRNHWTRSLARAERMAQILRSAPVRTPADMTAAYLRCLAELFGGVYTFTASAAPARVARDRIFPTLLLGVRPARRK